MLVSNKANRFSLLRDPSIWETEGGLFLLKKELFEQPGIHTQVSSGDKQSFVALGVSVVIV